MQNKGIKTGQEMLLIRVVTGGLSEEVSIEQRPNWGGASHLKNSKIQANGIATTFR